MRGLTIDLGAWQRSGWAGLGIRLRLVAAVLLGVSLLAPNTLEGLALASPVLTRYPYLTDATSTSVLVNFATNTPSSTATPVVTWGAAGGSCTTNTINANAGITITVGSATEYQYKGKISGLSPNTSYCYRVNQSNSNPDLLGSDPSPTFTTAVSVGASNSYSFAVLGDFGAGTIDENKVLAQIAKSNAGFIVTAGDNAYNGGSQSDYGDLTSGNVFGPSYWKQVGAKLPAFPAHGNHGFTNNLPYLQNWPQDSVVAASLGTQKQSTYCGVPTIPSCPGGTAYADTWYAFDWGVARYYVLEGAWADACGGTGPSYSCDAQAHFGSVSGCTPCGKELTWLQQDLAAHAGTPLKFAFWHYPLYSDNSGQPTDCYLNSKPAAACPSPPYTGSYNLEGLLANNNVDVVFNGHAHEYERNRPQTPGSPLVNYVTGGGGDPLTGGGCKSSFCAVSSGTFHYLLVNVNGAHLTVTPIDENGVQFDIQNYDFSATINGTVTAASTGLAIANAAVSSGGSNTTTNGSGQYTLTNVLPGTPNVSVSAPGFVAKTQAVTVGPTKTGTSNFSLASASTGAVSGTVTSSAGGGIMSATVTDSTSNTSAPTTDNLGNYTLGNLAPGSHSLTASATGFTTSPVQMVSVLAGQTTTVSFTLTAGASAITAVSTQQYTLSNNDGTTWAPLDATNLVTTVAPSVDSTAILGGNVDLFTNSPGYNQDLGLFVSDNGGAEQLLAWKESGGFAGIYSPNAAYVQAVYGMSAGHTYVFGLKWKTNNPEPGGVIIFAGAGAGPYSPSRLTAEVSPGAPGPQAVSTQQYSLTGSDGSAWASMDAVNLQRSVSALVDTTAILGANADLFTGSAGYNQDIGIFVSDNGGPDALLAWKESGGFAGTYSPNAAFVQSAFNMIGGHTYVFKVKWKTNISEPAGVTIYAGAGIGPYSPTQLTAHLLPAATNLYSTVSTQQYTLTGNDGSTWATMDGSNLVQNVPTLSANAKAVIGGNVDLFTDTTGFNQDVGIFVSDNGGPDTLLAWKESGGYGGTFSPNAAMVQTVYAMTSGHAYSFKLKWKTNKPEGGVTIYAGAGGGPYSHTGLAMYTTP